MRSSTYTLGRMAQNMDTLGDVKHPACPLRMGTAFLPRNDAGNGKGEDGRRGAGLLSEAEAPSESD